MTNEAINHIDDEQLGQRAEESIKMIKFDPIGEPPWLTHSKKVVGFPTEQTAPSFINLMLGSSSLDQSSDNTIQSFMLFKDCELVEGAICIFEDYKHIGIVSEIKGTSIDIISCNEKNRVIEITNAAEHGKIIAFKRPANFVI